MSEQSDDTESTQLIATLRELIEALDERVPNVGRAGEAQISKDAAALREVAIKRIDELTRAGSR